MVNRLILLCLLCLMSTACVRMQPAPRVGKERATRVRKESTARSGWRLVWADEFNRDGLPDPQKWIYEEGFVRNQEAQYYTRARKENCRIKDGVLVIEARKERVKNAAYRPGARDWAHGREFAEYTSGALETRGKATWKYGRFEIRAKMPRGAGTWPAFWTLGAGRGWPTGGEIDIMEWWGKNPDVATACVHYQLNGKHQSSQGRLGGQKPSDDFHVYALEWSPERLDFFYDGKKFHSFPIEKAQSGDYNPFRQPHYILLNFALGGGSGGRIDDSKLPQKFMVDYVRVYQKQ